MKPGDQIARNIDLTFDLVRQTLLRPDAADEIHAMATGGVLVYLDPEDGELSGANASMADRLAAEGEKVVRVEVQRRVLLHPVGGQGQSGSVAPPRSSLFDLAGPPRS